MKKTLKNNKGFTLVELIIVIIILGILAMIATPNLVKYVNKSRGAVAATNIENLASLAENYYTEYTIVPVEADLAPDLKGMTFATLGISNLNVVGNNLIFSADPTLAAATDLNKSTVADLANALKTKYVAADKTYTLRIK